jgi:serine/threonine protein kinase
MIAGRYTLLRRIGGGAMGTVWLARDETLHRQVAIKQAIDLSYRSGRDAEITRMRAMREGRVVARLNHPNAVTIYDVVIHDDEPWLVMEYVPSKTLTELVQDSGVLPPHRAAAIGAQLADALAEAHRVGIVHRDVKPGNVLLTETGTAKLTDFGIARGGGDTLTESGLVSGTPAYFAPEIARGADPGPSSDVWSLGATLYFAVEARPPFGTDDNPLVLLGRVATLEVPAPQRAGPLAPVLDRLLARSPEARPTMTAARAMLAAVADEAASPVAATRPETAGSPAEPVSAVATRAEMPPLPRSKPPKTPRSKTTPPKPPRPKTTPPKPPKPPRSKTTPPKPPRPKARTARLTMSAAVAVVLALAGLGWYLLAGGPDTQRAGGVPPQAAGTATPSSSAPTATRTSPTSPPPSAAAAPPSSAVAPMRAGTMTRFISDYYRLMPANKAEGWRRLGPGLRRIGYDSYTSFWSTVRSVSVSNLRASPAGSTVTATVVFVMNDGRTSTERHAFALVTTPDGTGLLINKDTLLRG